MSAPAVRCAAAADDARPPIDAAWRMAPAARGGPFERLVWGRVLCPDGQTLWVPAFFDGDDVWRVRCAPAASGHYLVSAFEGDPPTRRPAGASWIVGPAFEVPAVRAQAAVRVSRTRAQAFELADGTPFLPFGQNVAWSEPAEFQRRMRRMGAAGMNWSRLWFCPWADMELDHPPPGAQADSLPLGALRLDVAQRFDAAIDAAERAGIRLQLVLQHHNHFDSPDGMWLTHPYSRAAGGFLDDPHEFFTDPRARALTRQKYRMIVARWGYSPAIMAWELFNEVEFTTAWTEDRRAVLAWHAEMAAAIRAWDVHGRLVTTSAARDPALYMDMDFAQPHRYNHLSLAEVFDLGDLAPRTFDKPVFYGEAAAVTHDVAADQLNDRDSHLAVLWAGLTMPTAGAAQWWYWNKTDEWDLYPEFAAMRRFLDAAGPDPRDWRAARVRVLPKRRADGLDIRGSVAEDAARLFVFEDAGRLGDAAPGELSLFGLRPGLYEATWRTVPGGEEFHRRQAHTDGDRLTFDLPPFERYAVVLIRSSSQHFATDSADCCVVSRLPRDPTKL